MPRHLVDWLWVVVIGLVVLDWAQWYVQTTARRSRRKNLLLLLSRRIAEQLGDVAEDDVGASGTQRRLIVRAGEHADVETDTCVRAG